MSDLNTHLVMSEARADAAESELRTLRSDLQEVITQRDTLADVIEYALANPGKVTTFHFMARAALKKAGR